MSTDERAGAREPFFNRRGQVQKSTVIT